MTPPPPPRRPSPPLPSTLPTPRRTPPMPTAKPRTWRPMSPSSASASPAQTLRKLRLPRAGKLATTTLTTLATWRWSVSTEKAWSRCSPRPRSPAAPLRTAAVGARQAAAHAQQHHQRAQDEAQEAALTAHAGSLAGLLAETLAALGEVERRTGRADGRRAWPGCCSAPRHPRVPRLRHPQRLWLVRNLALRTSCPKKSRCWRCCRALALPCA